MPSLKNRILPRLALPRRLARCRKGSVLMEVVLTLPLILILFGGGFEVSRFALLQMKVSRSATTMADLVAQNVTSVTSAQIASFRQAIPHIGSPFVMDDTNTQIIVTAVKANAADVSKVCWQVSTMADLGESSRIGAHNATASLPDDITLKNGDTAIIAEIYYAYEPTVFTGFVDSRILYNVAIYRPRLATLETLLPAGTTCS
jgi:Flp pilus assembly protein TadG